MMNAGPHPVTSTSTDIAWSYLVAIYNLSPEHRESLPLLHGAEMVELVRQIGNKEVNPLAAAFIENMLQSGMMQHYFSPDRHEDAPKTLCLSLVQYGIRVIQVLERQFLRLSPLGYVKGESARLCMSSRLSTWEYETTQKLVTTKSLEYMDLIQKTDEYFTAPEHWPSAMTIPPSREYVEKGETFHYGINLKYAEFILWRLHARVRFPPPEEPETEV
jgi:hypothetical protein